MTRPFRLRPVHLVRAALAASACAYVGGPVLAEYVGAPALVAYLAPLVLGVVTGAGVTRLSGWPSRQPLPTQLQAIPAGYAVLGTALGFALERSLDPVSLHHQVLLGYGCAVAGSVLWTRPPKRRSS